MSGFFEASSYAVNGFALPVALAGAMNWILGIATLRRERGSPPSRTLLAMTFAIGVWLLALAGAYSANDRDVALAWVKVSMLGTVFVPVCAYMHAALGSSRVGLLRLGIFAGLFVSSLLAVLALSSDLVLADVHRYSWGYYPIYGPLGPVLIVYYTVFFVAGGILFRLGHARSKSVTQRKRMRIRLAALAVAIPATIDFLPALHVGVYPCGFAFILAYIGLSTFSVWRYRLIDITPALAARQVINTIAEALLVVDREGIVRVANPAADRLWQRRSLVGLPVSELDARLDNRPLVRMLEPDCESEAESACTHDGGAARAVMISSSKLLDHLGEWVGVVFVVRDVSERRRAEEKIRYLAYHDSLTAAATRPVLMERLLTSLEASERTRGHVGLIFVDLDDFKQINDTQGHDAGDEVLQRAAEALRGVLRDGDTLARVGGDEFVLLLPGLKGVAEARGLAMRALRRLDDALAGGEPIRASLGIAMYPFDGTDAATLLTRADGAMYAAKRSGGHRFSFWQDSERQLPRSA